MVLMPLIVCGQAYIHWDNAQYISEKSCTFFIKVNFHQGAKYYNIAYH